jgi:hypothetical protein
MTTDFLVPRGRCSIGSFVNKYIIFQQLPHLCGFCFFPEIIPILLIDVHRLPMRSRYKMSKFPERFMLVCTCFGLVYEPFNLGEIAWNTLEPFPSFCVKKTILFGIVGTSNRVTLSIKSRGSYIVSTTLYRDPL